MELTAVIEGLKSLKRRCQVVICTDSQYVKNGMESWIHGWKKNGWKTAAKKPVKKRRIYGKSWIVWFNNTMSAGRGSKATPDTLKTKKPTSSLIKGRQNLHNTSPMTVLKYLKPFFWIAVIALIYVTPKALMFAYSPFHDVNDLF